jgi:sec-independent protein translocase protein TatC
MSVLNRLKKTETSDMAFVDHLEALRWHILRTAVVVFGVAIVVFLNMDYIFDHIIGGPLRADFITYTKLCAFGQKMHIGDALCMPAPNVKMQVTSFGSQFMSSITIAFMSGLIIGFPYLCFEIWRFIRPALSTTERKAGSFGIFWVSFFFFMGVLFAYFLLAPFTFSFLSNFKIGALATIETKPTLDDYIENMVDIIVGTGLAFELPVFSFVLTKIGIVTPIFLREYRKYAYVIILLVAAVITPSPDWMSQMIVSIPLFLLYEISIIVSKNVAAKKLKAEQDFYNS